VLRQIVKATLMLAAVSCSQPDDHRPAVAMRDSGGVTIIEHTIGAAAPVCAIGSQPTVTIGGQESEKQQLYRVFGAARLSDGRIALVNSGAHQLRFYDRHGRFLQQVGRNGSGPGEFRDAFYLWVLPCDTIWVGDYSPSLEFGIDYMLALERDSLDVERVLQYTVGPPGEQR
jgi:hypothetical protein